MIAPCEYCGRLVWKAEDFLRYGVGPCCPSCRYVPAVYAAGWFLVAVAAVVVALVLP